MTPHNIKSNVLAALQPAEEIEGPDGLDYIRLMGELAVICSSRAQECAKRMESESVAPPTASFSVTLFRRVSRFENIRLLVLADSAKSAGEKAVKMVNEDGTYDSSWEDSTAGNFVTSEPEVAWVEAK